MWAKFHFPAFMVNHEKTSHARLIAEQDKAQPLIDALAGRQRILSDDAGGTEPEIRCTERGTPWFSLLGVFE
jgi:hypothetical protein